MAEPISTGLAAASFLDPTTLGVGVTCSLIARHIDPTNESWTAKFVAKFGNRSPDGKLPPNHNVEAACHEAVKNTLRCLAHAIDLEIDRSKNLRDVWARKFDDRGNVRSWNERWDSREGHWFNGFTKAIDNKIKSFEIPISATSDLNQAIQSLSDENLEQSLKEGILQWARQNVIKGAEPSQFEDMVNNGWEIEMDGEKVNLSVYKIWCLFFHHEVKKNEKAFKILTVSWLGSIDKRIKEFDTNRLELAESIKEKLDEQQQTLVTLRDNVSNLAEDSEQLAMQMGMLLPFVVRFRQEVGENFEVLRGQLNVINNRLVEHTEKLDQSLRNQDEIKQRLNDRLVEVQPYIPPDPPLELPWAATAGKMYGRRSQLNELKAALQDRKNFAVLGPAGYGKTALAARAIEEVVGTKNADLANSPYPHGVLFLNLYEFKSDRDQLWRKLTDSLAGSDFNENASQQERATSAFRGREVLVIVEGAEQANGKNGHVELDELLSVLSGDNRTLVLTRDQTQTSPGATVRLDEPLGDREAGWLFDRLTENRVKDELRLRLLELLQGHPLALTWAGGLLWRADQNPETLATEWESDPTHNLNDPDKATHTLEWLFERSVQSLDDTAKRALEAAGLLASTRFHEEAITAALGESSQESVKQLINQSLLRRDPESPEFCTFIHDLGYKFARKETDSDPDLRLGVATWLVGELNSQTAVGKSPSDYLDNLLQHANALLLTDHDQKLGRFSNYLLYDGEQRLESLGRLSRVKAALDAVNGWQILATNAGSVDSANDRERSVLLIKLGDLAVAQGDLENARQKYADALEVRQRLAESDTGNAGWQRDLSVSLEKLGNLAVAQGDLENARQKYAGALEVSQRLAESDTGNAGWQRDLSVSLGKLGDLAVAQGDLEDARQKYAGALEVRQRLSESDPGNAQWQRDLSVSLNKLGDLAVAQSDLEDARQKYADALEVRQRLAESDPGNAQWQRDLFVSNFKLADVLEKQGESESMRHWHRAHDVLKGMVSRGLFVSEDDRGFLKVLEGKLKNE